MLLKESSVLRQLPLLQEKQLLILDSLRFTIDIVDYNYETLHSKVLGISENLEHKIHPQLFHYVWSILDNIRRFMRIYKVLATDKNYSLITPIEYVNSPRNTYQHLDERIDESLIDFRQPFFGSLKWTFHDKKSQEAYRFIAISGILYGDPGKVEFVDYNDSIIIENIYLETVDRKQQTEINISQLFLDFKEVVQNLENTLENEISKNNLGLNDWSLKQDVVLKIKRTLPTEK